MTKDSFKEQELSQVVLCALEPLSWSSLRIVMMHKDPVLQMLAEKR